MFVNKDGLNLKYGQVLDQSPDSNTTYEKQVSKNVLRMLGYYQDTQYTTITNHAHSLIKEVTPSEIVAKQFFGTKNCELFIAINPNNFEWDKIGKSLLALHQKQAAEIYFPLPPNTYGRTEIRERIIDGIAIVALDFITTINIGKFNNIPDEQIEGWLKAIDEILP